MLELFKISLHLFLRLFSEENPTVVDEDLPPVTMATRRASIDTGSELGIIVYCAVKCELVICELLICELVNL